MRDSIETYKIWAPDDSIWAPWAKPVLFMRLPYNDHIDLSVQEPDWAAKIDRNTMVIIDLPGDKGVKEGLALARMGLRPVPLYNGVYGDSPSSMIIKVDAIVLALFNGADELVECKIRPDAPPVFLLDSNRMLGNGKQPGKYDNRWCVFPQDMPSAEFLASQNIQNVIVHSEYIHNDLEHILRRYHEKGIAIYHCSGSEGPKMAAVVRPSGFRSLSYRFKATFGLVRNAAGGFGGKIPEPTQSYSGGYHGIG